MTDENKSSQPEKSAPGNSLFHHDGESILVPAAVLVGMGLLIICDFGFNGGHISKWITGIATWARQLLIGSFDFFAPPAAIMPDHLKSAPLSHAELFPLGIIMISLGFSIYFLALVPVTRITLRAFNWLLLILETALAIPLMKLSLLKIDDKIDDPGNTE